MNTRCINAINGMTCRAINKKENSPHRVWENKHTLITARVCVSARAMSGHSHTSRAQNISQMEKNIIMRPSADSYAAGWDRGTVGCACRKNQEQNSLHDCRRQSVLSCPCQKQEDRQEPVGVSSAEPIPQQIAMQQIQLKLTMIVFE